MKTNRLLIILAVTGVLSVIWLLRSPWLQQMGGAGGIIGSILHGSPRPAPQPAQGTEAVRREPSSAEPPRETASSEQAAVPREPTYDTSPARESMSAHHTEESHPESSSGDGRHIARPRERVSAEQPSEIAGAADGQPSIQFPRLQPGTELTVSLLDLDSRKSHVGDAVAGTILSPAEFRGDILKGRLESVSPDQPGSLQVVFTKLRHRGNVISIDGRVVSATQNVQLSSETPVTVRIQP